MAYRVLMVEHDRLMLEKLTVVVNDTPGFELAVRYQAVSDALGQGQMFNPNLILLDVENRNAVALIADFQKAYPYADILCMGEKWRAESASHIVQAGARGYIIKPFTGVELQEAVDTFNKLGSEAGCETLVFCSPKGKSGKTTLIANLAVALGRKTHEQVGIIDADLQFGDMAVFFNLAPQTTIVEATRDERFLSPVTLHPYYMPVTQNVSVLCGTAAPNLIDKVAIESFENVITMSRSLFRYLLIDVPPGFNPTSIAAAEQSTTTFLVSMVNGAYEIAHMKNALEIFKDWDDYEERVKTIFTRVEPCNAESQQNLSQQLGYKVTAIIPNEYSIVSDAADNGKMATDLKPDSPLAKSVDRLADDIIGRKHRIRWDEA